MSLILPFIGAGALCVATAQAQRRKADFLAKTTPNKYPKPIKGTWRPVSSVIWTDKYRQGRYKSVTPEVDVRGVPVFLVDWGNGAKVYQYAHPDALV